MALDSAERPARQRNARGEGAKLRAEVLTATRQLLDAGEAVTLRSIARGAGIAAPSIYRQFADLHAIMFAVADEAFVELKASLVEKRDEQHTPVRRLRALSQAFLAFAAEKPELYRVMFGGVYNAASELEAHPQDEERIRSIGMDSFALLVDGIQECVDAGASDSTDVVRDASALFAALHGLASLRQVATLFPWPEGTDVIAIDTLARIRPER